jgi:hypothetical protein
MILCICGGLLEGLALLVAGILFIATRPVKRLRAWWAARKTAKATETTNA